MHSEDYEHRNLQMGNYLGLKFEEGWFFTIIQETEYIELKPWILMNSSDTRGTISANTAGSQDDEIEDTIARHLVEPADDEQNLIFQLSVGIAPSRMQVYPIFGRDRSPNLQGGAEPQDPQVPMTGFDTPYNNPTSQGEIFTVDGMSNLSLQAYNPMDEAEEARLSIGVNKMKYVVIDDVEVMADFVQGRRPVRAHPVGLGSQTSEQVRTPTWMEDAFGDAIKTTEEILEESENTNAPASGGAAGSVPGTNMG